MQYGILVSLGFLVVGVFLLLGIFSKGIRFMQPQTILMLITLNNKNSCVDVTDVRFVVATMFQAIEAFSSKPTPLTIERATLSLRGANDAVYDVTFNKILPVGEVFSAKDAFWNAPNRKPLSALRYLVYAQLSMSLLDPTIGPRVAAQGTRVLEDILLNQVNELARSWGVRLTSLTIGDWDTPAWMTDNANTVAKARAEAEAFKITKEAEGQLWAFHEFLDTLKAMPGLRVLSGVDGLMEKMMAAVEATKDEVTKEGS
jgi:hypothetical protein